MNGELASENGLSYDTSAPAIETVDAGVGEDQFADPMTGTGTPAGGLEDETSSRPGINTRELFILSVERLSYGCSLRKFRILPVCNKLKIFFVKILISRSSGNLGDPFIYRRRTF